MWICINRRLCQLFLVFCFSASSRRLSRANYFSSSVFLLALTMNVREMMSVLIMFVLVSISHVSALEACPNCGSMQVPYPLSTNDNCGNPRYRVYCNNGSLEFLSAQNFFYQILSINPSAYKFIIRPPLIQKNTCYSSDLDVGGLLLDENSPFNISTHNTVMLFNCSETILLSPLNCSSVSPCRQFEKVEAEGGCIDTLCCSFLKDSAMTSHRIRVRVGGCTAYTSVVDFNPDRTVESWNYGIELQWVPPNWVLLSGRWSFMRMSWYIEMLVVFQ